MTANDREARLARLRELRTQQAEMKHEEETLRDELVEELGDDEVLLVDPDTGEKLVAKVQKREPLVVNVGQLAGYIDSELLDEITERKIRTDAFKAAVAAERIAPETFLKVASYGRASRTVVFDKPKDASSDA